MKNLCCGFLLLMTSVAPAVAETVYVNPSVAQVAPGDSFTVHVDHTGFPRIGAGTVGIEWNPAVLRLDDIAPPQTPSLKFEDMLPTAPSATQAVAGRIDLFTALSPTPSGDPSGNFRSVDLEFTAIAIGTSPINILDDSITTGWNASSDASIVQGVVYNQGTITVGPTSIPIPTLAIWLLAFSLGAVVHLRLRGRAGDDSLNGV